MIGFDSAVTILNLFQGFIFEPSKGLNPFFIKNCTWVKAGDADLLEPYIQGLQTRMMLSQTYETFKVWCNAFPPSISRYIQK